MIRVALVEDEESSQRALTEYLERFSQEINEKIHVSIFPDGAEIVEDYRGNYEILPAKWIQSHYSEHPPKPLEIRRFVTVA